MRTDVVTGKEKENKRIAARLKKKGGHHPHANLTLANARQKSGRGRGQQDAGLEKTSIVSTGRRLSLSNLRGDGLRKNSEYAAAGGSI